LIRLQKDLTVEAVKKSNIIHVRYKNKDRVMAASVVNALSNLYLDRHLAVYKNPESYKFFEEQSRLLKEKLARSEHTLKVFKEKHDLSSLEEQRSLLLKENSALRTDLNQTESQVTETRNRLEQLRRQLATVPKTIPQGRETDSNPFLISSLQAKLMELELKERELLDKYTEKNRLVVNVKEEIAMVRQSIYQHEQKRYEKNSSGVNTTYQEVEQELLRNDAALEAVLAKQKTQSNQLSKYQGQFDQLNRIEVELNQIEREVEVNRQNYLLYLSKFEESRISDAMDTERIANVSLVEPAHPPLTPVSPNVMLNLALGIFLGAFGALGMAFFTECLDDSLEEPEEAEKALQIPVLASVPKFKR
jgi:polysaccharide biosynthesis protein PslE